jgi:hypothetical protein
MSRLPLWCWLAWLRWLRGVRRLLRELGTVPLVLSLADVSENMPSGADNRLP